MAKARPVRSRPTTRRVPMTWARASLPRRSPSLRAARYQKSKSASGCVPGAFATLCDGARGPSATGRGLISARRSMGLPTVIEGQDADLRRLARVRRLPEDDLGAVGAPLVVRDDQRVVRQRMDVLAVGVHEGQLRREAGGWVEE